MNQLDRIIEITGTPSPEDIEAIQSPFAATMLDSLTPTEPRNLADVFPNASPEALDLLRLTMQFNPEKVRLCDCVCTRVPVCVALTFVCVCAAHHGRGGVGAPLCGAVPRPGAGAGVRVHHSDCHFRRSEAVD